MSWRSLRAMRHHHETQPLPSRLAPCLHLAGQRIPGAAAVQAVVALTTEFVGAWLLLLPTAGVGGGGGGGGVANGAVLAQLGLQLGIVCSGGFGFFNLLTAATCVACANDAAWWLPPSSPSSSPSSSVHRCWRRHRHRRRRRLCRPRGRPPGHPGCLSRSAL